MMLHRDLHSHLMPGIDDGSRSPVETIAMARGIAELGVECVYLTPHQFKLGNRLAADDVHRRADEVARLLQDAGVALEVRASAEHYYGEDLLDAIAGHRELVTFDCDGLPCLLVELPMTQPTVGVRRVGEALVRRGITPVLAHPERTAGLRRELDRLHDWLDAGWKLQLNLLSLVGGHGREAEVLGTLLLQEGAYEFVGSDLHRPSELRWLREAHEAFRSIREGVPQP